METWTAALALVGNYPVTLLVGCVVALLVVGITIAMRRRAAGRWSPPAAGHRLALLAHEKNNMMDAETITTATFFDCEDPQTTAALLRANLKGVIKLNPWLAGRLVSSSSGVQLWVPEDPSDTDCWHEGVFKGADTQGYEDVVEQCKECMVPNARASVDTGAPVFRVGLLRRADGKGVVVVVSLCHMVGDGHTFYTIYKGLGKDGAVALDTARVHGFHEDIADALGSRSLLKLFQSPATILGVIWKGLTNHPTRHTLWEVSASWIAEQKANHNPAASGTPFVSTNDVLTGWYFSSAPAAHALSGSMVVDGRGRHVGLTATCAGNYMTFLSMNAEDRSSAHGVRRALNACEAREVPRMDPPTTRELLSSDSGFVTSWMRSYCPLVLPGATETLHVPVFPRPPIAKHAIDYMVVFRPSADTVGVLLAESAGAPSRQPGGALARQLF